jgi:aryl-alcohol dehydrogenase-like predicted oxidoreductase
VTTPRARLGLGTAQLGLPYGIANEKGRPDAAAAAALLAAAAAVGVEVVDTAPAYGFAEARLGALLPEGVAWRIVTKTMAAAAPGAVRAGVEASLRRLRRPALAGLLVHDRRELLDAGGPGGDRLWRELVDLREQGLVERIGVSVYHPDEVMRLLARYPLDLVQVPLSVLDQRVRSSGALAALAAAGVEVHARSAFLQGLLLLEPERVPAELAPARAPLARFRARVRELGCTPLQAALGFVAGSPGVGTVVCGAEAPAQVHELAAALGTHVDAAAFADLACSDLAVVDPSTWPVPR